MAKRNRYKFRNNDAQRNNQNVSEQASGSAMAAAVSAPAAVRAGGSRADGAFAQHASEYRTIRNDMIRLVILNFIMLVAVFALYYANRSSGLVENLYTKLFR